jgi:hypothetical protein
MELAAIGHMIKRRHPIVHRADRAAVGGALQKLTIEELSDWIIACSRFMKILFIAYLKKRFPDLRVC